MNFNFISKHKGGFFIALFTIAYAAILAAKFWGLLWASEILPGNDTVGHFWAFHEFYQALVAGHFWHYSIYWFGGMPLFQFYAPLGFIFMSGVYFLFSHVISQFIIFRWYVFLTFAVFPLPFYFFVKSYLGKKAAYVSLPIGLLLIFYPTLMNFMGFGAVSAIAAGLFDQMLAVDFLLFYLVVLKKLVDRDDLSWKWMCWGGISLSLVFLSHTLTSIMAGVLTFLIGIFYFKRWFKNKLFYNLAAVILLGFLLSAFWLVPFVANLRFASADRVDVSAFLSSPLNVFAPFNLGELWHGGLASFPYIWIIVFVLFLAGLISLVRRREYLFPSLFLIVFFVFGLDYVNPILPALALHYYRLLGYDLLIFLAIAAWGVVVVFEGIKTHRRLWLILLGLIGVALLAQCIYFFNLFGNGTSNTTSNSAMPIGPMTNIDYHWSLTSFPGFRSANKIIADLTSPSLPETPIRIMPDMSPSSMMEIAGSIHFFNTALPLANGQSSLFGLYAESAWQLPFIFPTANLITGNGMLWGRVRDLAYNSYFNDQDLESMVKRLQLFGINYMVVGSDFFYQQVQNIKEATLVKDEGQFKLYSLSGSKPMVYPAAHTPGLFVRYDGLDFREFALGWYSVADLLDYPVAEWTQDIGDLNGATADQFGFIAVELDKKPSTDFLNKIRSLGKPVIFLNESAGKLGLSDPSSNILEVDGFQPVALVQYNSANMSQPNAAALTALAGFIKKFADKNRYAANIVTVSALSGQEIDFNDTGPTIINLSYFPYWQCAAGCDNVYPVTPGQMLVFGNGDTKLAYEPGTDTKVGEWLSVIGLAALIGLAYLSVRSRRRTTKA